jgi:hypothetical protein
MFYSVEIDDVAYEESKERRCAQDQHVFPTQQLDITYHYVGRSSHKYPYNDTCYIDDARYKQNNIVRRIVVNKDMFVDNRNYTPQGCYK